VKDRVIFVGIVSDDPVFYTSFEIMFKHYMKNAVIKVFKSLSELKSTVITAKFDLFLVDDIVAGAAILEPVSFIRQNRQETCTILYFGEDVHDMKTKSFRRGVNYFYSKPIDPRLVVYEIATNWVALTQNNYTSAL
jgi:DNA-binding NtrC family response regulator